MADWRRRVFSLLLAASSLALFQLPPAAAEERPAAAVIPAALDVAGSTVEIIRTTDGRDVPVRGELWIAPDTGRMLRSRFTAENFAPRGRTGSRSGGRAVLEAVWRPDERLGLWVPGEMHERYDRWVDEWGKPYDIEGSATYSNYRRFTTATRLLPP